MSSYLNFYLEDKTGHHYKITSFSRGSFDIYNLFDDYLIYGSDIKQFPSECLFIIKEDLQKQINSYKEDITLLGNLKVDSANIICEVLTEKNHIQQMIKDLEYMLNQIEFIHQLVEVCEFKSDFKGVYYNYD